MNKVLSVAKTILHGYSWYSVCLWRLDADLFRGAFFLY